MTEDPRSALVRGYKKANLPLPPTEKFEGEYLLFIFLCIFILLFL